MERELKIGQHLVFIDADRKERDALLICVHGPVNGFPFRAPKIDGSGMPLKDEAGNLIFEDEKHRWPCVNLVVVNDNPEAKDQYGRQTVKDGITSVVHWADSSARGFCWRFVDEEMIGAPAASIS